MGAIFKAASDRVRTEQELVELCAQYDGQLSVAYAKHHAGRTGHLHVWLGWGLVRELVTPAEDQAWRDAMQLRNAILTANYKIELSDVREHIKAIRPIVERLRDRIAALPPSDDTLLMLQHMDNPPT